MNLPRHHILALTLAMALPCLAEEAHDHSAEIQAPNGGRVLMQVSPHIEFLITPERKVRLTALDDHGHLVAFTTQVITLTGVDRMHPTRMSFVKSGDALVSDITFPAGNHFPVVLQIHPTPKARPVYVKFNLNLSNCSSCKLPEYACTCEH